MVISANDLEIAKHQRMNFFSFAKLSIVSICRRFTVTERDHLGTALSDGSTKQGTFFAGKVS